jgi:Spy/CpxP family protein refolding chaperone
MKTNHRPASIGVLLCLAVFAFAAFPARAGSRPESPGGADSRWHRGPRSHRPPACWTAGLTDAQAAQLKKLRQDFRAETRDLQRELRQRRLALAAELAKQAPDAAEAGQIQRSISDLRTELSRQRLQHLLQAKQIAPDLDLSLLWRRGNFAHRR